jgi:AraC-like DNA-binding protein
LDEGYSCDQVLGGLGIQAEQLNDEEFRLSIEQHERFILRTLDLTGDPHFIVRLFQRRDPTPVNLALLAIANGGQVGHALHLITRYSKIFTRTLSIRSFEIDEQVIMHLEPHLEHSSVIYFALSNFILFLDLFFCRVLEGTHLLTRIEMSVPEPPGFNKFSNVFGVPITFSHEHTSVYFDRSLLDRSMKQADPQTVRLLMEIVERQLGEVDAETSFEGVVNALIAERISSPPGLEEAARILGLSARSLRRKLAKSNTTYQRQVDSVRSRMAMQLLRHGRTSVSAVARALGYENPSDFSRAFKRWTGRPPSAIR